MTFQIMIPHSEELVLAVSRTMTDRGIKVINLLESPILDAKNRKIGEAYLLVCLAGFGKYRKLKKDGKYSSITAGGMKTLFH